MSIRHTLSIFVLAASCAAHAAKDKQQADAFLEMYCDRSGTPMQVVRQWMPVVAASELARNREGQDRDALLSWVDVVDYQ